MTRIHWSFLENMTQRIEPFLLNMTQRIEPFFNMTHRIDFFSIWLKELNFYNDSKNSIFEKKSWHKELNFFLNMTQRIQFFMNMTIEPFFLWLWLKVFSTKKAQRIDFSQYDSKNWTPFFSLWPPKNLTSFQYSWKIFFFLRKLFTDLNPSFQHDSKNWTL